MIDHLQPHEGDLGLFYDEDNLWLVCKEHHDTICQAYDRKGGDVRAMKLNHRMIGLDGYPVTVGGGSNP